MNQFEIKLISGINQNFFIARHVGDAKNDLYDDKFRVSIGKKQNKPIFALFEDKINFIDLYVGSEIAEKIAKTEDLNKIVEIFWNLIYGYFIENHKDFLKYIDIIKQESFNLGVLHQQNIIKDA